MNSSSETKNIVPSRNSSDKDERAIAASGGGASRKGSFLMSLPLYLFTFIFVVGPLVYLLILSFMTRSDSFGVEYIPTLDNYRKLAEPLFLKPFLTSLKLALICTSLSILIGYPFAYFMTKFEKKNQSFIMTLLTLPFGTNSLIRLYGWVIFFQANGLFDRLLMGLKITSEPLRLLNTYPIVVFGMIYALITFMIFSVYSSIEKMDWSLVEAARDLGASRTKAFFTVTLKLTLPGLLSGVILTFVPSMGLFFIADILGGNKIMLIGNLIQQEARQWRNFPFAAALAIVLTVMTTLLLQFYKFITKTDELEGLV